MNSWTVLIHQDADLRAAYGAVASTLAREGAPPLVTAATDPSQIRPRTGVRSTVSPASGIVISARTPSRRTSRS